MKAKAYLCFCTRKPSCRRSANGRRLSIASPSIRAVAGRLIRRKPGSGGKVGSLVRSGLRIPEHPIRLSRHRASRRGVLERGVKRPHQSCVSNGMPVYNYVVVIDDALMKITHVIRGGRSSLEYAQAGGAVRGSGLAGAGVLLTFRPFWAATANGFQAARGDVDCEFPRNAVLRRGAVKLFGFASAGRRREYAEIRKSTSPRAAWRAVQRSLPRMVER